MEFHSKNDETMGLANMKFKYTEWAIPEDFILDEVNTYVPWMTDHYISKIT